MRAHKSALAKFSQAELRRFLRRAANPRDKSAEGLPKEAQTTKTPRKSFGEFVLAETQTYHGWVRLSDGEGWVLAVSAQADASVCHLCLFLGWDQNKSE